MFYEATMNTFRNFVLGISFVCAAIYSTWIFCIACNFFFWTSCKRGGCSSWQCVAMAAVRDSVWQCAWQCAGIGFTRIFDCMYSVYYIYSDFFFPALPGVGGVAAVRDSVWQCVWQPVAIYFKQIFIICIEVVMFFFLARCMRSSCSSWQCVAMCVAVCRFYIIYIVMQFFCFGVHRCMRGGCSSWRKMLSDALYNSFLN